MNSPARVYADESYGDDNSFLIQTAVALPAGNVESVFNQLLEERIQQNSRFNREEFKGQGLSARNEYVFKWFLQQTINIMVKIAEETPCRTVITIDSMQKYCADVFEKLYKLLRESLDDTGYKDEEIHNAGDFIRQVIWLHARLSKLIPSVGAGDVELYFDEKYRMDLTFKQKVTAWVPKAGSRIMIQEERWQTYTRLLSALLKNLPQKNGFPKIVSFTYVNSKSSYFIQAADLLSNLTLNAIRHRMGVTNNTTLMKYNMLCSVMTNDPITDDLLASFIVASGKVSCRDAELFSSIELCP